MAVSEYDISILNVVLQTAELRIGCSICTTKEEEITYSIKTIPHKCQENLLLAKLKKDGKCWRPISKRPEYPNPMQYDVCWFFAEGSGCTVHRKRCTFARSPEEVLIWNFLKRHFLDLESLISLISELEQNVSNLEGVSENIFADWSGEFQELCRECFNGSPCRITERESSHVCGTVLGHRWTPMMVHCLEQTPGNRMFSEIRPLPPKALLQLCCHDTKDKSPGHSPLECQFAHNKVELAVWKQEINSEWNRMELLWLSQKRRQPQHSNEVRLLSQNTTTKLHTSNDSTGVSARGPMEYETSYQDRLLKEYRDSDKTVVIMAEHVDEVDITHDEDLYLECQEVGTEIKWTFQIKTERLLSHVALLKNEPGAIFNLGDSSHNMACTYSVGNAFVKSGLCYEVTVTFKSSLSGLFEQWLVLDFDIRPVLLQKLKVRVWQSLLEPEGVLETFAPILERWHKENRVIMPYLPHLPSRTQDELLKTYDLPQKKHGASKTADSITTISRQNYRERMHHFLFEEEHVEAEMVSRRTENAINNIVKANDLVQIIALGWHMKKDDSEPIPKWHILKQMEGQIPKSLPELNDSQQSAVVHAVNNKFTLIQGPPGTGKTVVGAYIAYLFCKRLAEVDPEDKKEVVLYCGPSHKSVDVVAEYLLKFEDGLKPLRVYSKQIEMQEFPYPGSTLQLSRKSRQEKSNPQLRSITMHYRFRDNENPYSEEIKAFDEKIKTLQMSEPLTEAEEKEIENYKEVLNKAREYELKRHDVILCTCTAASSASLTKFISAKMILIDECAMATEPQALVPLVSYNPQKIVLLGDHKQLRPIVTNERAKKMGMSRSLFERCITYHAYKKAACTLNTQYRMHEEICKFPSSAYYNDKLITASSCKASVLQIQRHGMTRSTRIVFVDIKGEEISQFVSTKKGNEKSVTNREESIDATKIAGLLVNKGGVNQEDIAILSPYNAQVSDIKRRLNKKKLTQITVCTITKSQGSEWRYVILSVVRSCPIQEENTREFRSKHIGFVGDANQINVGITRAQDGLCILGNQELLTCSKAWKKLLKFYTEKNCVVTAEDIDVRA
ncbi:helicase with zinc finger domain 2-like isoform X9 [Alosa sapidissima]|uniref:helicase with zinc finger domain 2-like isoform X9 n=1 Tax=Alosa sapidissima TaxID=34773 RepID=UPI001C09C4A7|nr:helicase with zinc finger domain 2-like isoform X9 [Alosa sapidissima]